MVYQILLVHFHMDKSGNYVPKDKEEISVSSGFGFNPCSAKTARAYIDTRKQEDGRKVYHVFHYDFT